jgi:class 3 adenylate cyclase
MRNYATIACFIALTAALLVIGLYSLGVFQGSRDALVALFAARAWFPVESPQAVAWLEILLVVVGAGGISWCLIDVSHGGARLFLLGFAASLVAMLAPLLSVYGVIFDPSAPLVAILLAATGALVFSTTEWGSRKRVLERTLGTRVSSATFRKLLTQRHPLDWNGVEREVTVVTCRIFSPSLEAAPESMLGTEERLKMVNLFYRTIASSLVARGGYLDPASPEQVRVYFGLLSPSQDHAAEACTAALDLRTRLRHLRTECENRWFCSLDCGVGLATDRVTVGIYGSRDQHALSGLGGVVDYSRRLSGLNQTYRSDLIVSEATAVAVEDRFAVRPLEMFFDASTQAMTETYQLLGATNDLNEEAELRRINFWKGVVAYRGRRYDEALEFLSKARWAEDDGPLDYFISRCQEQLTAAGAPATRRVAELTEEGHARTTRYL